MSAVEPDWLAEGLDHIWLPYSQMKTAARPVAVRSTHGARIVLHDGRELVDGIGSWWTAVHGYNNPYILEAMRRQLDLMPHVMLGGLGHEQPYRLAARLAAMLPGDLDKVFFCESGSVSVEVALKIAVQYWRNTTGQVRPRFLAFRGGYHGDTFAAMSVCDPDDSMHSLFGPALAKQVVVDLPEDGARAGELDKALELDRGIAAVIVEPMLQGAAGMRMHDATTLKRIREACDRHGVLLIFDEIFTGFGRLGGMFAANVSGVTPDITTLGKALTGGAAPLAATIASSKVYAAFHSDDPTHALMHGPTYTGHALGCAAANASLDLFEREPRLQQVAGIETHLRGALSDLASLPQVADVRIRGSVAAVEMRSAFDLQAMRSRFIDMGVFIRPIGKVIYLAPAYTIPLNDLATLTSAIVEVVESAG
ncbi:MAG TPA: adenosylmethionine--8-amino-7-oxononanoate transaminase [Hyphomonadaceae bacterium]|nr:adenosylmethionine--8-amino-7-oxononanoate transaminase [Hyphomonadaceae bacterium]